MCSCLLDRYLFQGCFSRFSVGFWDSLKHFGGACCVLFVDVLLLEKSLRKEAQSPELLSVVFLHNMKDNYVQWTSVRDWRCNHVKRGSDAPPPHSTTPDLTRIVLYLSLSFGQELKAKCAMTRGSWFTGQSQRRIGMTKEKLPYGHLLQRMPRTPEKKVNQSPARVPKTSNEMTEEEVNASPAKSSSDLEHIVHSESEDEFDDRPKKKARISKGTPNETHGSRERASLPLPAPPSNIKRNTFSRRNRRILNHTGQSAKRVTEDEDPDLSSMKRQQKESQGHQKTYHKNIHARPSGKENRAPKYKPPPVSEKSSYGVYFR